MKKIILSTLVLVLVLFCTSCTKPGSATGNYGTWTIKGTTYTAIATTNASVGSLTAISSTSPGAPNFTIDFGGYVAPTTSGTDSVVAFALAAGQVDLNTVIGSTTYSSIGGGTTNVTVSGGKVTVSGTSIRVASSTPVDTETITFNIHQE